MYLRIVSCPPAVKHFSLSYTRYTYVYVYAVHHILNHKEGNAGGNRVQTHDRVVRAVAQLCKDVGLVAETNGIRGLLPPDAVRGGRHECMKTVDISITGLDSRVARTLGDVVVPHPFSGDGRAKYYALKREVFTRLKKLDKHFCVLVPTTTLQTRYFKNLFGDAKMQV